MSTAHCDFGPPFAERVEFHFDRRKAFAIGGCASVSGFFIASALTNGLLSETSAFEVLAVVLGLIGAAVLSAFGLFILLHVMLRRGPAIVIDRHGIHDRRSGAAMTPWSCIHDIRVFDRYGLHIGIDTQATAHPERHRLITRLRRLIARDHAEPITVIDTYFLKSATGNRTLDFVMPMTALTPINLSETPVSAETLSADAAFARARLAIACGGVTLAGLLSTLAAVVSLT